MSDVLHDEWDRAYEEGREVGRKEAWSGDYDYRKLMEDARERAIRDAMEVVARLSKETYCDSAPCWGAERYLAAIKALRGER